MRRDRPSDHITSILIKENLQSTSAVIRSGFRPSLLLKFLTRFCTQLSSIDAPGMDVAEQDMKSIALRFIYFSLGSICPPHRWRVVEAEYIHTMFPRLMGYQFGRWSHQALCPQEVSQQYSLETPRRYIECSYLCSKHRECPYPVKLIDSTRALLVCNNVGSLRQIYPKQLDNIQLLYYKEWRCSGLPAILYMPNLLYVMIDCIRLGTRQLTALLSKSSKIKYIQVKSELDGDKDSLRDFIQARNHLEHLSLQPRIAQLSDLPFSQSPFTPLSLPIGHKLTHLSVSCACPIFLQSATSNNLKYLQLEGEIANDFSFCFPNLVTFSFRSSRCKQDTSKMMRCLRHSPLIESFIFTPHELSSDFAGPSEHLVDYECVENFLAWLKKCHLLRSIEFGPFSIDEYSPQSQVLTLDINELACRPDSFTLKGKNLPMNIILPSHGVSHGVDDEFTRVFLKNNGLRRRRSIYDFVGNSFRFSFEDPTSMSLEKREECRPTVSFHFSYIRSDKNSPW